MSRSPSFPMSVFLVEMREYPKHRLTAMSIVWECATARYLIYVTLSRFPVFSSRTIHIIIRLFTTILFGFF